MKKIIHYFLGIISFAAIILFAGNCKKTEIVQSTTDVVNIYDYLKQKPDQYSSLVKVIDKSGYAGFLNAYGSYTMFAPTNDAMKIYLTEINKTVDQLTEPEAQNLVKFHLMEDTLTTATFKDGKLPIVTMFGQYLITSITNTNGVSTFTVNRQALVVSGNIITGNGLIHSIDHVLKPATKSLGQLISEGPEYSIFKQALEATDYIDTLNTINTTNPSRRWLTVLAETNQALLDSGIASYAALKTKYSNLNDPKNPMDSLHIYVAYHIMTEAKYLADIVSASSHSSLQPLQVLASKLDGEKVLINDIDFNGTHEIGVELKRTTSDISATNGVLHSSLAHFSAKIRVPVPVYWDVADFPEVRKLPAIFRRANLSFPYGSIKDINWDKTTNTLDYAYSTGTNFFTYWGDYLSIPMGNTSRHFWIDFTTPILVKGRYKVWVCYRTAKNSGSVGAPGGSNMPVQVFYDGQPLSRPFNFVEQRPNLLDGELEALGWKKYSPAATQLMTGKYLGFIDVQTTDRHKIRIQALPAAGTGQPNNFLDMIHFIPINDNQYLPRFTLAGGREYF
ncbi:MAG: fasciclin domain-containing protein [Chitinophagaceae bacterium]